MKKTISILFIISIFSNYLLADAAPMLFIPGGNVAPTKNFDVQMQSETITISLFANYFIVEVSYNFVNFGKDQKIAMGFPSSEHRKATRDFKAFDNKKELFVYQQDGEWEFHAFSKKYILDGNPVRINVFDCYNVDFKEGESKIITNTYKSSYQSLKNREDTGLKAFYYILQTGSLWKDSIDSIRLVINTDNINHNEFILEDSYFQDKPISFKNFDTTFYNIEPNFDLYFMANGNPKMAPSYASSELYSQGGFNYTANNLLDYDKTSAWVEGVSGYDINESVQFTPTNVHYSMGGPELIQIDSLSIINGYAYNDSIFLQNSRVKKIKLSYKKKAYENNSTYTNIYLDFEDTQDMQTFVFSPPLICNNIEMTILDIYKGAKYADTAISEVEFHVQRIDK